jgi:hypothetical protein
LLTGLTTLLVVWEVLSTASRVDPDNWPAAVAATTGWAVAVVIWLHRRGWRPATAHAVGWIAPAVLLAPLSGSAWLSPAGLVLWAPMTTVLAAALVMATQPTVALCTRPRSLTPPRRGPRLLHAPSRRGGRRGSAGLPVA